MDWNRRPSNREIERKISAAKKALSEKRGYLKFAIKDENFYYVSLHKSKKGKVTT